MEQQMKSYIKALKKSINQERFLIRVAGLEYEVAQKVPQAGQKQENCGPGREKDSGRCGKNGRVRGFVLGMYRSDTQDQYQLWYDHFLWIGYRWEETDPNPKIVRILVCVNVKPHESTTIL